MVEFSLVILIVGLLFAAVTAGTDIIKNAEIRSIITDFEKMETAFNTFKDRYDAKPGDFTEGSGLWGTDCAETPANCNGNGDGIVTKILLSSWPLDDEYSKAYMHLTLAGLLPGNPAPIPDSHVGCDFDYTAPSSQSDMNFTFGSTLGNTGNCGLLLLVYGIDFSYGNIILLGTSEGSAGNYINGAVTPLTAFSIDKKMDDGKTIAGKARGYNSGKFGGTDSPAAGFFTCALNDGNANAYNITNDSTDCVLVLGIDKR